MIRASVQISRAVNKYKNEFPVLFEEYELGKRKLRAKEKKEKIKMGLTSLWISLSEKGHEEYLLLVDKYLKVTKFPSTNRKVWITTHDGGKHVGFYEDSSWWYSSLENPKLPEKGTVIKWGKC